MAFNGKVALITGGGSGMGQKAALMLAEQGAQVAIFDVNDAGMEETASSSANIKSYHVDISDTEAVQTAVAQVESELGPIDRVANAAAIMPFGKLLEQDPSVQIKLMEINYNGLVNIATATVPAMVERGSGDFISFSSMSGIIPGLLMGGYCATKAAVSMYTEILYHENLNSGVRFVCVCPPPVATPLWKQAKDTVVPKVTQVDVVLTPEEVINHVEASLEKGEFLSFPGKGTKIGYRVRNWIPSRIWDHNHKVEGF